jgi:hypothetical protein
MKELEQEEEEEENNAHCHFHCETCRNSSERISRARIEHIYKI